MFGFLSAGIVLTSSLVLPQVNIFKRYLTLARFPSGWQPVLFQPGTRFRKECHSHTFQGATWKWVSIALFTVEVQVCVSETPACWT